MSTCMINNGDLAVSVYTYILLTSGDTVNFTDNTGHHKPINKSMIALIHIDKYICTKLHV